MMIGELLARGTLEGGLNAYAQERAKYIAVVNHEKAKAETLGTYMVRTAYKKTKLEKR